MNHELPKGWIVSTIRNVSGICEQKVPDDDEQFLYVDIGSIDRDLKRIASPQSIQGRDAPSRARKCISTGDVLVSLTRPNLNAVALVTPDFDGQVASTGFEVLRPVLVDSRYLFYLVRTRDFIEKISGLTQGALYPAAKSADVREYQFPLAPLSEQIRIADKLDRVLARVNAAQSRLDKIPALIKRFRQSVLAAATSGELTKEYREERHLESWGITTLGHLVSKIEAGKSIRCDERPPVGNEVGIVKISAVTWGRFQENESKTLKEKSLFIEERRIKVGDFLISRANTLELLGMPVIVNKIERNLMLSDKVLRLVMPEAEKAWVNIFLRSPAGRQQIESRSTGNQESMRNIGQKALLGIEIPHVSVEEKSEIVRRVESLFALADTVEKQYQDAKARTDRLTQAILAKAFRGELVPQNPDDEPAEALLQRIQQQRAEQATAGKRGKARKVSG